MARKEQESDPAASWDQAISDSLKKLKAETRNVVMHRALALTAHVSNMATYCPLEKREPGKMDQNVRRVIRSAAQGLVKWPLTLVGPPGTGKTCAGLCVVDRVSEAYWCDWERFTRFMLDVNFGRAVQEIPGRVVMEGRPYREPTRIITWKYAAWWSYFEKLPLAVLDDIGLQGKATEPQYKAMKTALDTRNNLPLILTSNLSLDDLGKVFDHRVHDRISGGTVIELKGESLR